MSLSSSYEYRALKWATDGWSRETQPVSSESDITGISPDQIRALTAAGAIITIPKTKKTPKHHALQTHVIAFTPAGLVVDRRAHELACKAIVGTVHPYRLISDALEPLRSGPGSTLSTQPWVLSFDRQIEAIDSNSETYFASIDNALNIIEKELSILGSDLSKPPGEINFDQCSGRIEAIKEQLKAAANSLGPLIEVYGNDRTTEDSIVTAINNRINDLNKLFKEGHRLNQAFETFKRNNLRGLEYLLNGGKNVGKTAGNWYLSGGSGRLLVHAAPYIITAVKNYFSPKDENKKPDGWISPETQAALLFHGTLLAADCAVRSIISAGILFYNRGNVDIFDFSHLSISDISSSASGAATPGRMLMVQRKAFAQLEAQRTLASRTIDGYGTQIGQLEQLQKNLRSAREQLQGNSIGYGKKPLSQQQIYNIVDDLYISINALLEENLETGDAFPEIEGFSFEANSTIDEEDLTVENLELFESAVQVVIKRIKTQTRPHQSTFRATHRQMLARSLDATRHARIPLTRQSSTGLTLRSSYVKYTSEDKIKYFTLLAQKVKRGLFYNLDPETQYFLNKLCEHFNAYIKEAFQRAIITQYSLAGLEAPSEETLQAFESAITPYRS